MQKIFSIVVLIIAFIASPAQGQIFDPLDKMPILQPDKVSKVGFAPIEQRGIEFRKYLAPSVKISVSGSMGSGTIVYYDDSKNIAYVASCGHLWSRGIVNSEDAKRKNITCKIVTYYHNDTKLKEPKSYNAKVLFYSYVSGQDTSLLSFQPDWKPSYFPIAPVTYQYKKGQKYHSLGCDQGTEVAHYDVEALGLFENDLVTIKNSPRPGRSGGGLLDDEGFYIGTCWGTQNYDGSGKGYFTPLSAIHSFWSKQKGFEFLLNQKPGNGIARSIPIFDYKTKKYIKEPEYILLPLK